MLTIESPIADILSPGASTLEESYKNEVLKDFWICCVSREASILGRREVLTGKAKFGIVGDGKEVPQVAMARAFKKGDWRSGYYRDQTFMFALGLSTVEEFFAQLYADAENDPWSGGRQMNSHFATPIVDEHGEWLDHKSLFNISSDISSTGGQMARAVGLALASKKYRESATLADSTSFSQNGDEVCFCTIGDASTSEGVFWEAMNSACVQQLPMLVSVWDDGYGISVPIEYQTTKGSISKALSGFQLDEHGKGMEIYVEKCWNYPALCERYEDAAEKVRLTHIPALIHVEECTQQLGHSTSGSHERYKSPERLEWEREYDCIKVMGTWMVDAGLASQEEIDDIHIRAKQYVKECRDRAWEAYISPVKDEHARLLAIYEAILPAAKNMGKAEALFQECRKLLNPLYFELVKNARQLHFTLKNEEPSVLSDLNEFLDRARNLAHKRYHSNLYSSSKYAALNVPVIEPVYSEDSQMINGYEILNHFFNRVFEKYDNLFAFGEDVGKIGGVNQAFMGLQDKYGVERIFDTGIREWTIVGQAIGMAMRGLRPIAEIQYLDYLIYGLEPLTDDLATLRYRSNGLQQAPAIIRTRGHRLEGIWHSGSPLGMMVNSLHGMYILVPRNFVQAAGMYNTLLHSDDPAILVECLNAYRLKEKLPDNIGEYTVPLGVPEILQNGEDVTLVTYGSCVRVAMEAVGSLHSLGISVELIDVQTLLPFDLEQIIVQSLKKTNRILFFDEDVPGGCTAFMMQEVLEKQGGYRYLDSAPLTLTAKAHRPPYGSDGDYFSKPNPEDICEAIYEMIKEADPSRFS
ncbi:MAG: transketolase [Lewinellaceae bacterium]|nr:transketolase [Saprospiraceae bacterium]MCB9341029.1 transketolase [Lewinellaceae bacterium]